MKVMVTGGAGYIGSHVVRLLNERGDQVVIVDDVHTGRPKRTSVDPVVEIDLASDRAAGELASAMLEYDVDLVVHLAARKQVGESVARPAWYYRQNIGGLANLLLAMEEAGVSNLLFSSSAAVYGNADGAISESDDTSPINPYGETKLFGERLIEAATKAFPLRAISLRYFNVAGAGWPEFGDRAALNLVPIAIERIGRGLPPIIFGEDYETDDGTCVRDYVHVLDVAEAHLAAIDHIPRQASSHRVYNVGSGSGASVRTVIDLVLSVSHSDVVPELRQRRAGDPAVLIASTERIGAELGWRARRGMPEIVASAWESYEFMAGQAHSGSAQD